MKSWMQWGCALGLGFAISLNAMANGPTAQTLPSAKVDWAAAARMDIEAIHATLRDNHPGPVDAANPAFSKWLTEGRALALEQAATATHAGDYWRAVRRYTNGFRDGHIHFGFSAPMARAWPGLLTMRNADGRTTVVLNDEEPAVPRGAELLTCDGLDAQALQQRWVDPYRWNADIPHDRTAKSVFLMMAVDSDAQRPRVCRFRSEGREFELPLRWSSISEQRSSELIDRARGSTRPPLALRQIDQVWFVSLPTFHLNPEQVHTMRALIRELGQAAQTLREAPWVVLDVRGNTGGNSGWGSEVASALFGKVTVERIEGQFDWTVDWRASPRNAMSLQQAADDAEQRGQLNDARYRRGLAAEIAEAATKGLPYVRKPSPARITAHNQDATSPFKGRVFLLTDHACASACLDFVDIARRLPGVIHLGLPTSADSIYIDNTGGPLPSGQGAFSYSMKVYRNRIRSNNQWYEPAIQWPGGAMTDETVAAWVRSLKP